MKPTRTLEKDGWLMFGLNRVDALIDLIGWLSDWCKRWKSDNLAAECIIREWKPQGTMCSLMHQLRRRFYACCMFWRHMEVLNEKIAWCWLPNYFPLYLTELILIANFDSVQSLTANSKLAISRDSFETFSKYILITYSWHVSSIYLKLQISIIF